MPRGNSERTRSSERRLGLVGNSSCEQGGKQRTKAGGKGHSSSMPSLHRTTAGQQEEDEGEARLEYEQNLRKKTKTGRKQKQGKREKSREGRKK